MKTAIVAIVAEWDKPYLKEWIEWHQSIGIDDIFVVTNNWDWKPTHKNVWSGRIDGKVKQLPAYNLWLSKLGTTSKYDWAFFIDVDEFIYPGDEGLAALLEKHKDAEAVGLNWKLFGDSGLQEEGTTCLDRFTKCQKGLNKHVKIALKLPTNALMNSPHSAEQFCSYVKAVNVDGQPFEGPFCESTKWREGMPFIAHFFCKTFKEYKYRRSFGRADCD